MLFTVRLVRLVKLAKFTVWVRVSKDSRLQTVRFNWNTHERVICAITSHANKASRRWTVTRSVDVTSLQEDGYRVRNDTIHTRSLVTLALNFEQRSPFRDCFLVEKISINDFPPFVIGNFAFVESEVQSVSAFSVEKGLNSRSFPAIFNSFW